MVENYSLDQIVGAGQYGKVYRAKNVKTGKIVAIKVVRIQKFKENPKLEECTVNEIKTLSQVNDNKHVVSFIELLRSSNNYYFVYEYCNGGTLEDLLLKKKILKEKEALQVLVQLLEAFKILRKFNIMHRDLKPTNILLNDGIIKLADFGFCKSLAEPNQMAQTMLGSPLYMAPEILRGEEYCNKADIWSLGVVLYELLFGFCPFEEKSIAKLINLLAQSKLTIRKDIQKISSQTETLLHAMLTQDPDQRISWEQLFSINITPEGDFSDAPNSFKTSSANKRERNSSKPQEPKSPTSISSAQRPSRSITPQNSNNSFKSIPSAANGPDTPSKNISTGMVRENSCQKSAVSSEQKTKSSSKYDLQTSTSKTPDKVPVFSLPTNVSPISFPTIKPEQPSQTPPFLTPPQIQQVKEVQKETKVQIENESHGYSLRAQNILIEQGVSPQLAFPLKGSDKFQRHEKRSNTTTAQSENESSSKALSINNNILNTQKVLENSNQIQNSYSDTKNGAYNNSASHFTKCQSSPLKIQEINIENSDIFKERNKLLFTIQVLYDVIDSTECESFDTVLSGLSQQFYNSLLLERVDKIKKMLDNKDVNTYLKAAIEQEIASIEQNEIFKQSSTDNPLPLEQLIKTFTKMSIASSDSDDHDSESQYLSKLRACIKLLDIVDLDNILISESSSNIGNWKYTREIRQSDKRKLLSRIFSHNYISSSQAQAEV